MRTFLLILCISIGTVHAGTSPRIWTSKANPTNTVTARLVGYKDGVIKLKDGDKLITVNEVSLSDQDRAYLLANCNPNVGLTEAQCDGITERDPAKTEQQERESSEQARRIRHNAIEIMRIEREVDELKKLVGCLSCNTKTGSIGTFYGGDFDVDQIITTNCAMITYRYGDASRQAFLEGHDFSQFADGCRLSTTQTYCVVGTRTYQTAIGGTRTLHVIKPLSKAMQNTQ